MPLRKLRRHLTASTEELHREQLRAQLRADWSLRRVTSIAEVAPRGRIRIGGEVQGVQVVPRAGSPSVEVAVHDGTDRAVAIFTGRPAVGGMAPGRRLILEGMAVRRGRRLELLNPIYTLLP